MDGHISERGVRLQRLGNALIRLGQFEQSVEPLREAIRLDPQFVPAYGNLAASLLALNRLDEARAMLQQAADRELDFIGASRLSYLLAFVQGDAKTMARELEASIGLRQTNSAFGWQAHASAAEGRVKAAHEQYRRGIQMSLQGGLHRSRGAADHGRRRDARDRRAVRRRVGEVSEGLRLGRDNATLERAGRVLALCGARNEAAKLVERTGEAVSGGDADDSPVDAGHRRGRGHSARTRQHARSSCWSRCGHTITRPLRNSGRCIFAARRICN